MRVNFTHVPAEVLAKAGALLLCFLSVVSACSSSSHSDPDTLEVGIHADPISLDPRLASDAMSQRINRLLFRGLFQKNERLEVVPDLAEGYEMLSPTSYRVRLKKGIRFHHGGELTAADVVSTIESILHDEVASPFKAAYARIAKITAEDAYTVRFELTEAYAPFLLSLCYGILPAELANREGGGSGEYAIGTGPYRFVRWQRGRLLELVANEAYAGALPKTKFLRFHIIQDDNTRVLKMLKGDLDIVLNEIPPLLLRRIERDRHFTIESQPGIVMAYLGINLKSPILKEARVRRAIALGINRDELIRHRRFGYAAKASSLLSPSNWAYAEGLDLLPYDPEMSRRLLDQAGFKDPDGDGPLPRFTLALKTSTVKERIDNVRMIAHQLAKVGIGITVETYEWGTFFRDVRTGNFELYSLQWVGVTEPDIFHDVFHSQNGPPDGLNRGGYKNARVDRLVEEGRRTLDPAARKVLYAEVQRIVLAELPMIPLWYEDNIVVARKEIQGIRLRPDGSFEMFMNIEKHVDAPLPLSLSPKGERVRVRGEE